MDLQIQEDTVVSESDYTWLRNPEIATQYAVTRTFALTNFVAATHYPNGRLKPGIFVARYTGGSNVNLWGPYHDDAAAGETAGLNVLKGILVDNGEIRLGTDGNPIIGANGAFAASVILVNTPAMIIRGNLPAMLESDGTTAFTPDQADIETTLGMIDDAEAVTQ